MKHVEDDEKIWTILKKVGMEEKVARFHRGLNTILGREFAAENELKQAYGDIDIRAGFHGERTFNTEEADSLRNIPGIKEASRVLVNPQVKKVRANAGNAGSAEPGGAFLPIGLDNGQLGRQLYHVDQEIGPDDVVLTSNLAVRLNAKVNQLVEITLSNAEPRKWNVAGIIPAPQSAFAPGIAFFQLQSLQEWTGNGEAFNLVLLELESPQDARTVATRIRNEVSAGLEVEIVAENEVSVKNKQSMKVMG